MTPLLGTGQLSTSRQNLDRTIAALRERVAASPDDAPAAVLLADGTTYDARRRDTPLVAARSVDLAARLRAACGATR